jgi:Xaa-Pro aminopeptidase
MTDDTPVNPAEGAAAEGQQSHDPMYPPKLLEFMRTGWADSELPLEPRPEAPHYARRRQQIAEKFPGETLVIPTGPEKVRANDTNHLFRPGSDFVYLTGDHDPESVLVINPDGEATLYVHPRSPRDTDEFFKDRVLGELWVGRRRTLGEKSAELGIRTAHLKDLDLSTLPTASTRVLRDLDEAIDKQVARADDQRDHDLAVAISEFKLIKDDWEIAQLQDAIDATVRGFEDVARVLPADRPVPERLLDGVFLLRARHDGNDLGYSSIVGAGAHATILHWIRNDGHTKPGELLLMDMGVEGRHLYTADVTRTIPVSGTFSPLQRQVYDIVYASQQAGIDTVKPGVRYKEIRDACNLVLAQGLADLGVLPCSVEEAMAGDSEVFRRWTLHGFGHMLGIDVHDCANARKEMYVDGQLWEGYCLTVEPGLYFQSEDELVPAELRGIGVRIEDDILVTADGNRNLSAGLPRTATDVENWLAAQRAAGHRLPG